jgi:hypothetical protein
MGRHCRWMPKQQEGTAEWLQDTGSTASAAKDDVAAEDGWFIQTWNPVQCPPNSPTPAFHVGELVDVMVLGAGEQTSDRWEQSFVTDVSCDGKYSLTWGKGGSPVNPALSSGIEAHHLRPSREHLQPLLKSDN